MYPVPASVHGNRRCYHRKFHGYRRIVHQQRLRSGRPPRSMAAQPLASLTLTALAQVSALSCNPASFESPNGTSACVVTLNQPATTSSSATVALRSKTTHVSLPASAAVTAGATTASFTATARSFTSNGSAQITASLNGQSQVFTLTLNAAPQIQVTSVTCSPTSFNGGSSSTCKVTLSAAPTANGSITLSSNASNVIVPATVAITSGHTSAPVHGCVPLASWMSIPSRP